MADTSHLERMGTELKCPICLSLLNSAVSLTCNHVFCGSCIEKSMKSLSNCPVCKVPFRRREIRPAPHMDNLVGIYKSMEIASGVNIFVTQNVPSTQISERENQADYYKDCGVQENSTTYTRPSAQEHQERCKKKGRKRSSKVKPGITYPDAERPSFPTKKRVHVPQFTPPETPMQPAKSKNEGHDAAQTEPQLSPGMKKDKRILDENEEPVLSPFFWLRDHNDEEKLTQQTDEDLIMETPPDVPCFSDIKDSDDEIPNQSTPIKGTCVTSSEADFIDSEMFEWTQRACSPELYSSPVRMKVLELDDATRSGLERNGYASENAAAILDSSRGNRNIMINKNETAKPDLASSSSPTHKNVDAGSEKSGKRCKKAVLKSKNKRPKSTVNEPSADPKELEDVAGQHMQKKNEKSRKRGKKAVLKSKNKQPKTTVNEPSGDPKELEDVTGQHMQKKNLDMGNASNVIKKGSKRKPKVDFEANVTEMTSENLCSLSRVINLPADMLGLSDKKRKRSNLNESVKISEGISVEKGICSSLTATKMKAGKDTMTQNQCEVLISHLPKRSSPEEKEASNNGMVIRKCEVKSAKPAKDLKRVKFSEANKYESNLADNSQSRGTAAKVTAEGTKKLGVLRGNSNGGHLNKPSSLGDASCLSESIVDKIVKNSNSFLCAFCRSAEESEATGIMVHYLEGEPVTGDQIGGPSVIHSHKNCAEWAPNVFFQDDKAINLENELMRSRRIKCSFCGIKGAALGCYEKSCRKSFHVPCAKITPECRWDHDNFVMLCPLHASCNLPCEVHISQSNRRRKSVPERPSDVRQPLLVRDEGKSDSQWKSHSQSKNLVLCCSGLTEIEKGIISKFEKLSGAKVSKSWDTSVTHVIASVDENGACKRTLKFLMGVLEGKWILTTKWVHDCINSMGLVDEKHYEIEVDVHGIRDGPSLGRIRLLNKEPKLFNGYNLYFMGDFEPSYKKYLHDIVIAGGGTILNRKPISENTKKLSGSSASTTFIIYSLESPEKCDPTKTTSILNQRRSDAKALARSTGSVAVSNSWILNSIAACKLQKLT